MKNGNIKENNFYMFIPTLLLTIPCGSMSLMVYTLNKPLFKNK